MWRWCVRVFFTRYLSQYVFPFIFLVLYRNLFLVKGDGEVVLGAIGDGWFAHALFEAACCYIL